MSLLKFSSVKSKWVHSIDFFTSCIQKSESIWKTTVSYTLHVGLFNVSQSNSFTEIIITQQHISALIKSTMQ